MRIQIRTLTGEGAEVDLEPSATIAELKVAVEEAVKIPASDQRLIYAGAQLEEVCTDAWKERKIAGGGELAKALGIDALPVGAPLRLEHFSIQKGSVVQVARGTRSSSNVAPGGSGACAAEPVPTGGYAQVSNSNQGFTSSASAAPPGMAPPVSAAVALGGEANVSVLADGLAVKEVVGHLNAPKPKAPAQPVSNGGAMRQLDVTSQGGTSIDVSLWESLQALGDLELHAILSPLLRQRPAVTAALLSELPGGPGGMPRNLPAGDYVVGRPVQVWSNSAQKWFSGSVSAVAHRDMDPIPAGSVEVSFELGKKWISPHDLKRTLRVV